MKFTITAVLCCFFAASCWTKVQPPPRYQKIWGSKPVYMSAEEAKRIYFDATPKPVINAGNIYVKGNTIYQLEMGRGIHVINNTVPSQASRIGFITVNGSSQISIKNNLLYTNSYKDLVVLDISNFNNLVEVKRIAGALPYGLQDYFLVQPTESGYYQCPRYDSVVVGWVKDSIMSNCYKN